MYVYDMMPTPLAARQVSERTMSMSGASLRRPGGSQSSVAQGAPAPLGSGHLDLGLGGYPAALAPVPPSDSEGGPTGAGPSMTGEPPAPA